jgi:hypothetical protein
MSASALPKELRESLRTTGQFVSKALLISAHKTEGTAVFDPSGLRGDFFPAQARLSLAEAEKCQLLLQGSKVVINVRMSPGRSTPGGNGEHFPFELVAWEALDPSFFEPSKHKSASKPAGYSPPALH